ncbi:hypothetical protein FYJ37_00885 [[Clostridium] scindens]|uniref:EF-hand domain-containing protein n=1 Tax=Clostridium scindens (strain JCM 10418 / VPI 12708) TaxID=29347 RepID=A0A844F9N3_CLOSV|nr:hypothetical protein [[Clostridium] scindens]MSS38939.1 hypothetical protein [[Clostridium] scindens]
MPRAKKTTTGKEPANKQKGTKKCNFCHEEKKMTDFYISKNPIHSVDERVPICKECIAKASLNEDGTINELELNKILKLISRPYYKDLIESSIQSFKREHSYVEEDKVQYYGKEILQKYFTLIAMRQDRDKSYEDSERESFVHRTSNTPKSTKERIAQKYADITDMDENGNVIDKNDKKLKSDIGDFEITDEIVELFGDGYSKYEYKKMYEKYEKLKLNYSLQTNIHQEALATYVRFKVKEEDATARGNVDEAKKWYDAAQNAAEKAKLTPKQLTKADLDSGVNSVSELTKAVEQAVDVIKIMPRFKYRPNDAPDFNIWCYVDYERKLNDQPSVSYEDVYSFYDKKREEYIAQNGDPYGIFDNEPTLKNRDTVKTFIKLPDDYEELAGNGND